MLNNKGQVIYGKHPVLEALNEEVPIEKIMVLQGTHGELEKSLREKCRERSIPLQQVPKEVLFKWSAGNNHQGIVAIIAPIEYQDLKGLLPFILNQNKPALFIALDRVTDTRNLGAIARSAELLGVDAIIVSAKHSARIDEESIKTSAGALLKVAVCRESSLISAIDLLKSNNIKIAAADSKSGIPIYEVDFKQPCVLIMGSEDEGVHPSLLAKSDYRFKIPQTGTIDSFNVSVAAGISLYEIYLQRQIKQ
ncbi:MAG: 23S rRNA (guanosine(2251)-2'-O)-methyltransferase RlmB [Saprospiraceae bacterium]